jgi:hypothetical protein
MGLVRISGKEQYVEETIVMDWLLTINLEGDIPWRHG